LLVASDGKKCNAAAPRETKVRININENCKLASEWDPENPDENVEY